MNSLLLCGFQIDFLPGGSISVPKGDKAIPLINECMDKFDKVVFCADQHPANHNSFAANHLWRRPGQSMTIDGESRLLWDMHCVKGSFGAEIHPKLEEDKIDKFFNKGTDPQKDSYSCFWNAADKEKTGLEAWLSSQSIDSIFLAGMPLEFEIRYTALDAIRLKIKTHILEDACFALDPEKQKGALEELAAAGAIITDTKALTQINS